MDRALEQLSLNIRIRLFSHKGRTKPVGKLPSWVPSTPVGHLLRLQFPHL
jgi:hypothetical protein